MYTCLSSSRKSGVRTRECKLNPSHWLVIPINNDPIHIQKRFNPLRGAKYDWFGLVTTRVTDFPQSKYRYNCTELVAHLLELHDPETWGIEEILQHYIL